MKKIILVTLIIFLFGCATQTENIFYHTNLPMEAYCTPIWYDKQKEEMLYKCE